MVNDAANHSGTRRRTAGRCRCAARLGLLAAASLLAGCGAAGGSDIPAGTVITSAVAAGPRQDPDAVLTRLSAQLHTRAEALQQGLSTHTVTTLMDARQECEVGAVGGWPAQWVFDERIYLTTQDARPAGRSAADRYRSNGWTVQTQAPVKGTDRYTFSKDGFIITLAAGADDGSLDVQSTGPCVSADGSLATTATSPS